MKRLPVGKIIPPKDWRDTVDNAVVGLIAESLKHEGLREPIVIVPSGHIVHGVHRWAAAKSIGLSDIECVIEHPASSRPDHDARVAAENFARRHLSPAETNALRIEIERLRAPAEDGEAEEYHNARYDIIEKSTAKPTKVREKPRGPGRPSVRSDIARETGTSPQALTQAVYRARKKEAEAKKSEPFLSDSRGVAIPAGALPSWELLTRSSDKIDGLLRLVQGELKRMLTESGEGTPLAAWVSANAQRWRSAAHSLAHEIRSYRPVAVCVWCNGGGKSCQACTNLGLISDDMLQRAPPELRGEAGTAENVMEAIS